MGCFFETAKQQSKCSSNEKQQMPSIKVRRIQRDNCSNSQTSSLKDINTKDNNQVFSKPSPVKHKLANTIDYTNKREREQAADPLKTHQKHNSTALTVETEEKEEEELQTHTTEHSFKFNNNIDDLQISCAICYPLACHKSNYCYNSIAEINTRSNSCRQLQNLQRTTKQHEQHQYARTYCQNATAAARNMATTLETVCAGADGNIQEIFVHARDILANSLSNVSNSLVENISYYAPINGIESFSRFKTHRHCRCRAQNHTNCYELENTRQQIYHQHHLQQLQQNSNTGTRTDADTNTNTDTDTDTDMEKKTEQEKRVVDSTNSSTSYNCNASTAAYNYIGHTYYNLLRNSISFYAASSVILVLCYLTTTTSAAAANSDGGTTPIDKHPIFDESSSDKEILDLLLEKKRYDKRLLPPVNDEDFCCGMSSPDMAKNQNARRPHNRGTLTVNVNVLLLSLASPDESSLKYEVEFLLNQQWNDPRLEYGNKSHYPFLNALHHHDSIWTPDTYFIMHGDFKDPIIPMHFALRIYRNGTIWYAMRRHLILSCQGSLHIFPFDDPKCSFSMESISYEEAQIKYVWKNDEDTLRKSPSLTTLNAYLIKNQTTPCDQNSWRGNYSCLRVDLIFTRDRAFYFTTVFIPGIILVTSSFITFWLEWNAVPARSMIGVTTMLNFFTTSNGFRSTLPVVSNLTAMNVWDGVCMCFIYASLLEFVCVNYVGRKRPLHNVVYRPGENPVTQRLPAVLSRIGVILASPLEIIEREFHAALSSEKTAAGFSSVDGHHAQATSTKPPSTDAPHVHWQPQQSGFFSSAVQNIRARSVRRRQNGDLGESIDQPYRQQHTQVTTDPVYTEPVFINTPAESSITVPPVTAVTSVSIEDDSNVSSQPILTEPPSLRQSRSMSTNTPPLILRGENIRVDIHDTPTNQQQNMSTTDMAEQLQPLKPPRRKSSRSTSPSRGFDTIEQCLGASGVNGNNGGDAEDGEKKRDTSGPNEIVACTTCGGSSSPCTHSANNGCATETCFVQVRKKEPPHPIRVAKTIDVIARITFPTAYAIFLIFFFVHYKGFS
ncbi:uncharacterized protein LOC119670587 isoform X3 [Teleopsis dalmanni]|uniref:uncharacterized protein LOC119670587 isoform X3 n=1 Tax=Teleopsis dalmanni TaxID=139649 RepID=UPI0018CD0669|nr:uncharacterized protein LOC119670587 isoform X3 [Teleopsis dalmanni]